MSKTKLFLLFLFSASLIFGELIGPVPEILKPQMLVVKGGKFYTAEGTKFSIFNLVDLKLLKTFGKKGEGPGELREVQHYPNKITIQKNGIFVTGIGKAIRFSKNGDFIREFKTTQTVFQLIPAGDNLISKEFVQDAKAKKRYVAINLYNADMKKLKELYRQEWVQQQSSPGVSVDMGLDFISVAVGDGRIFIDRSSEGFLISVFDYEGKPLYDIRKDIQGKKLSARDREELEAVLRDDPQTKQQSNRLGGWKEMKKFLKILYPDHYAPIKSLEASGNKLYVRTFNKKGDNDEYIVMDLKGNIEKTIFIRGKFEQSVLALIAGGKLSCIDGGKLYYLQENEDEEEWELHVEQL